MRRTAVVTVLLFFIPHALAAQVQLVNAFPSLTFPNPVGLYAAPDSSHRLFVVSQDGTIAVFPDSQGTFSTRTFLDVTDSVVSGGELGLLGLAFHPRFASNRYFYAYYTVNQTDPNYPYASILSRFTVAAGNPDSAVRGSELRLMRINQPFSNHNGGQLAFGPDGYLYWGLGDGGSGGDPFGNGQSKTTWLGKILRINVDSAAPGLNYAIPPDNPFAADPSPGIKKEIFAYGLRNPWRFSFDPVTGRLWAGDVGQDSWEEVDTIQSGGNYGWNTMEATHCYNPSTGCNTSGLILPLIEYGHVNNQCSITGGTVYRGAAIPALVNRYVYGDYCAGRIWSFDARFTPSSTNAVLLTPGFYVSSFGVDDQRELYVCDYGNGRIMKFTPLAPPAPALLAPADNAVDVSVAPLLTWRTGYNASRYRLELASDSLFGSPIVNNGSLTDTTFHSDTLAYSAIYYWRVRAANGAGEGPPSPVRRFTTEGPPVPPPPPNLISPPDSAQHEPSILRLRWSRVHAAASYDVLLAADAAFTSIVLDDSAVTDTFRQVGPLTGDSVYYWKVRGRNAAGIGSFSAPRSFTVSHLSYPLSLAAGWNLVSLPVIPDERSPSLLFPGAVSRAFGYEHGYGFRDTLLNGVGYWVRYADSELTAIAGTPAALDSAAVVQGWNLVGGPGSAVGVGDIVSVPGGLAVSQLFGYSGVYTIADSLRPGRGYWVKSAGAGTLFIGSGARLVPGAAPVRFEPVADTPPDTPGSDAVPPPEPREFALAQNFPNPFNPATTIRYDVPSDGPLTVTVYTMLGVKVATLVDGFVTKGGHSVRFDGRGMASGVYICRLAAGATRFARAMVLAK